jgi:hypothetical protein
MNDFELSCLVEDALVARNPRQMQTLQAALEPGYCLRAASLLRDIRDPVIIGTGFPVAGSFETDGPVGAIALYRALEELGAEPWLACAPPLADLISGDYRVLGLSQTNVEQATREARAALAELSPAAVVSIERPGLTDDGRYYNMRGVDITEQCGVFDPFVTECRCPTIGVGDGGNEIGMGKVRDAVASLSIRGAVTPCDELVVADVSNWGAYGLILFLGQWAGKDLLAEQAPLEVLEYLSSLGSVDGVTGENTLTEDGMPADEGLALIEELRLLAEGALIDD